jgi:hypothetical protein
MVWQMPDDCSHTYNPPSNRHRSRLLNILYASVPDKKAVQYAREAGTLNRIQDLHLPSTTS